MTAGTATRHRDAERSQELERAGGAQRQPADRDHEQHRDTGRHRAQSDARQELAAPEAARSRTTHCQHDHPCPCEADPCRSLRADPVEQPDGHRESDLYAGHRGEGHRGAGPGSAGCTGTVLHWEVDRAHGSSRRQRCRSRPRVNCGHTVRKSWMMVEVEPRRLQMLLELSRHGSMRAVAEQLGVTTSTVSQQLAVLAQEAGTTLLEPAGRRVRLTPAGERLAGHAVTILAAIEAARVDLDPHAEPAGAVRVAAFATAGRQLLLPVVRVLQTEHAAVRLLIHEHEPDEAMSLLRADDVDLALTYDYNLSPYTFDDSVTALPLGSTHWALGVPADAPPVEGDALAVFGRFRDADWVVNSRNTADEVAVRTVASLAGF